MQVKKETVKDIIEKTALRLFCQQGFKNTSMADIARDAKISTGNIYRYFRDKESLFLEVLPVEFIHSIEVDLKRLMILASNEHEFFKNNGNSEYWKCFDGLLGFIYGNRERILILLNAEDHFPHRSFRKKIENLLVKQAIIYLRKVHKYSAAAQAERRILYLIYSSFVESSFQILKEARSEKTFRNGLQLLRAYHLAGLHSYFCQIAKGSLL